MAVRIIHHLFKQRTYHPAITSLLTGLLQGLSWVYGAISYIRNLCYDFNVRPIHRFDNAFVISIGNVAVGGTGKTPCVAYMVRLLQSRWKIAVVSRGYGRKTRRDRIVTATDSATTVGDEPFQLYQKFAATEHPPVIAVGNSRASIIAKVLQAHPQVQLILLDDGLQHRRVHRDLNVVLTTFGNPFFFDQLLPLGTLREHKQAMRRADMVFVTKCPDALSEDKQAYFRQQITAYTKRALPIFFTHLRYLPPIGFNTQETFNTDTAIMLLTGIADTKLLVGYVTQTYQLVAHHEFCDHHLFTQRDIAQIVAAFERIPQASKCILTTEKDAARLLDPAIYSMLQDIPIFLLPIEMHVGSQEAALHAYLLNCIRQNSLS